MSLQVTVLLKFLPLIGINFLHSYITMTLSFISFNRLLKGHLGSPNSFFKLLPTFPYHPLPESMSHVLGLLQQHPSSSFQNLFLLSIAMGKNLNQWLTIIIALVLLTNRGIDKTWAGSFHSGSFIWGCSQIVAGTDIITKTHPSQLLSILGGLKQLEAGRAWDTQAPYSQFSISPWLFHVMDTG